MQPNAIEMCIESTDNPLFTSFLKRIKGGSLGRKSGRYS